LHVKNGKRYECWNVIDSLVERLINHHGYLVLLPLAVEKECPQALAELLHLQDCLNVLQILHAPIAPDLVLFVAHLGDQVNQVLVVEIVSAPVLQEGQVQHLLHQILTLGIGGTGVLTLGPVELEGRDEGIVRLEPGGDAHTILEVVVELTAFKNNAAGVPQGHIEGVLLEDGVDLVRQTQRAALVEVGRLLAEFVGLDALIVDEGVLLLTHALLGGTCVGLG